MGKSAVFPLVILDRLSAENMAAEQLRCLDVHRSLKRLVWSLDRDD